MTVPELGIDTWALYVDRVPRAWVSTPERPTKPISDPWLLVWLLSAREVARDVVSGEEGSKGIIASFFRVVGQHTRKPPPRRLLVSSPFVARSLRSELAMVLEVAPADLSSLLPLAWELRATLRVGQESSALSSLACGATMRDLRDLTILVLALDVVFARVVPGQPLGRVVRLNEGVPVVACFRSATGRERGYCVAESDAHAGPVLAHRSRNGCTIVEREPVPSHLEATFVTDDMLPLRWRNECATFPRSWDGRAVRLAAVGGHAGFRGLLPREVQSLKETLEELHRLVVEEKVR